MGIVDLNADKEDGLRRIFAHASHDERTVLSAAIYGVMRRPIKARGADIAWCILQRAANIDRRQAKVGPTSVRSAMPAVLHNARELADAESQRQIELTDPKTTTREYDLSLGLSGPPSREEIALLQATDKTFRAALRGHAEDLRAKKTEARDPDIDFQILWHLAAGKSQREVARQYGIKQQRVGMIKRSRLLIIYRDVIKPLQPTVSRPAPKGMRRGKSEPFGNIAIYVAEQRNFRSYGRESTFVEANKMGHSKNAPK
jgi:hypothetical protein